MKIVSLILSRRWVDPAVTLRRCRFSPGSSAVVVPSLLRSPVDVEALLEPLPMKFYSDWTSVSKHTQTEPTLDGNNPRLQRREFEITRNSTTWFCRSRRIRSWRRFSDDVEDLLYLLCHRGWSPVRPSSMTPATSDNEEDLLSHRLYRSLLDPVSAWMIDFPSFFDDVSHPRRVHLVFLPPRHLKLSIYRCQQS